MKLSTSLAPFPDRKKFATTIWLRLHLDFPLLALLTLLIGLGLVVLASAGSQDPGLLEQQAMRFLLAVGLMFIIAQIPMRYYTLIIPWLYLIGVLLLVIVMFAGDVSKGARRWLDIGVIRFQPSEIMKLTIPMMLAYYFSQKALPCRFYELVIAGLMVAVPTVLIARQPDLGTAVLIAASGSFVLFLAGMRWRYILSVIVILMASFPVLWYSLHDYQRDRIRMFINPENDPLGRGYHIIQSKIAIGSGGLFGKGWFNGTQSHLEFLPERSTDFIFAVLGEEFGYLGAITLLILYTAIIFRCFYISLRAQDTFSRLLAGSLTLTFSFYVFVNIGMVAGLLPVVGVPLPLLSYGGTSVVTLLAGFGILMSIHTHRKLVSG